MSTFPKVANIQVGDNIYDIKDNLDRAKYNVEKQRTLEADNTLILNKAALADVITEKGVTTDASDTLMQMAENISKLELGDSPALAELYTLLASHATVLKSCVYNYPWVSRMNNTVDRFSIGGTGGWAYERANDNPEYRDVVAVTRLRNFTADISGPNNKYKPILYMRGLITISAMLNYGNLLFKFNGGDVVTVPFPTTDTFTDKDFYIKIEVNNLGSNMCKVTVSLSEPDADGKYTTFNVIHTETVQVNSFNKALYISMLGVPSDNSSYYVSTDIDVHNSGVETEEVRYQNYLRETCVAMKDENGIYKVVLGASSIYPME